MSISRSGFLLLVLALGLCALPLAADNLRKVAVIDIPGQPAFDSSAFANGYLLLTNSGAGSMNIFDPVKRRLVARVTGLSSPRGMAVDSQGGRVYVANAGNNSISVIGVKDWQLVQSIPAPQQPGNLLYVPESGTLYVAHPRAGAVTAINVANGRAQTIELGGSPDSFTYDEANSLVLVTLQDRAEVIGLGADGKQAKRFQLAASQPTGLALDETNRRLYVAVRNAVLVLNADNGSEIARVPASQGTDRLWLDPQNNTLYAVAVDGTVHIIRAVGNNFTNEKEFRTEVRGAVLAYDPVNQLVYVPGGKEGRSKVVIFRPLLDPVNAPSGIEAAVRR